VRANQGAPGVDVVTLEDFEKDLKDNLYKIWNRMSSGSYFPPPVMAVEIPKPHGGGTRTLGVPTIADRVAHTVVARRLEAKVGPILHPDSYGYRPRRSALDAVAACRERCWKSDWVIDLDIQKFFDSVAFRLSATLCCCGLARGAVSAQSLTRMRLGTRSIGATGEASFLGILAKSWPSPDSTTNGDGRDVPVAATANDDTS